MNKQTWFRAATIAALICAALASGSGARAQGSKATVSPEVAKRTLMKLVINADTARAVVDACVAYTKAQPGNVVVAIYVLSPTGQIIDSHQMDGITPIGAETALMKARTVLYARTSTAAVAARFFNNSDGKLMRMNLGKDEGLAYFAVAGGLPIMADDQMIGSIGVGGGNADEQCAYQALLKVVGPQPPLVPAQPAAPAAAAPAR